MQLGMMTEPHPLILANCAIIVENKRVQRLAVNYITQILYSHNKDAIMTAIRVSNSVLVVSRG